ncbi:hypothetical protein Tco_0758180 [Tanacetum coccineum]
MNNVAANKNGEKRDAQRNNRTMNKRKNKPKVRYEFRPKEKEVIKEGTRRTQDKPNKNNKRSRNEKVNNSHVDTNCHSPKSSWKLNKENMKNRRRSANKFSVMEDIEDVEVFDGTKKNVAHHTAESCIVHTFEMILCNVQCMVERCLQNVGRKVAMGMVFDIKVVRAVERQRVDRIDHACVPFMCNWYRLRIFP